MYHNYSVTQALIDLFPDIGLDEAKFAKPGMISIDKGGKGMEGEGQRG